MRIIVVGAGIGGLTAHLVCKRSGFEVEHYERQPRLGPAGAGIVLWPNGVKILLALGLGEQLLQIGHSLERVVTRTHRGGPLSEMPVGELERKLGAPVYPVSRTDLQSLLVDAVGPGNLRLGAQCVRVEQDASGATAFFADGGSATGDVVLGADGIHSAVRRAVVGEVAPRYSGMANWVGVTANDGLQPEHTGYEFLGEGKRCGLLHLSGNLIYLGFPCAAEKGAPERAGGAAPATPGAIRRLAGPDPRRARALRRGGVEVPGDPRPAAPGALEPGPRHAPGGRGARHGPDPGARRLSGDGRRDPARPLPGEYHPGRTRRPGAVRGEAPRPGRVDRRPLPREG